MKKKKSNFNFLAIGIALVMILQIIITYGFTTTKLFPSEPSFEM